MGATVEDDSGNASTSDSNGGNDNSRRRSSTGLNTPKHFIPETVFVQKVSLPSDELGHGGYLPEDTAKKIFDSISKLSSPLGNIEDDEKEEEFEANMSYWDLCHVLQFGGM